MSCIELLDPRLLFSSAALQSDGTLRVYINDPEATIAVVHGKLRVFVQGYSLDYTDPENPDAQYHNMYTAVFKNYNLASVHRLDITTTLSGATSDFDTNWGTRPFFLNSAVLPCRYSGRSIFNDFQFGSGDDDVTNYTVGGYFKYAGQYIYDYRGSETSIAHIDFTRLAGNDATGVEPLPITIYGSSFADSFTDALFNTTTIYAGDGNDTVVSDGGDDLIYGEAGDDVIYSGGGADSVYGGAGNDTIVGEAGDDLLAGEAGDDKLYGGAGNDRIYGGSGRDTLIGDAGNDRMSGQSGSDLYYANDNEADVLTDVLSGTNRAYSDSKDRLINITLLS